VAIASEPVLFCCTGERSNLNDCLSISTYLPFPNKKGCTARTLLAYNSVYYPCSAFTNMTSQKNFSQLEIDQILNQEDLVLRNLQITLGYYRIAQGLRNFIGGNDVNWFCFGCYASKTAGQALRHELLPKQLKRAVLHMSGYKNTNHFFDVVLQKVYKGDPSEEENLFAEALAEVSLSVSEGNYLIFSELAWPYSHFLETFSEDLQPDWQKLDSFLDTYLDPRPIEDGGQAYLRQAFKAFFSARFETDPKKKAEWVLLGNLMTGYHEQIRVQPLIDQGLAAPFDVFAEKLMPEDEEIDTLIEEAWKRFLDYARLIVLRTFTDLWMAYALPGNQMRLGQDVALPKTFDFPDELLTLENQTTLEIVRRFDKDLNKLSGSAADNWGNLNDRMTFLADFFRSHQRYAPLFAPPFSDEQMRSILANRVPEGPL